MKSRNQEGNMRPVHPVNNFQGPVSVFTGSCTRQKTVTAIDAGFNWLVEKSSSHSWL